MIRKLLQYLGADPIEDAMSVRDIPFIQSVAESLHTYKKLTDKQKEVCKKIIEERTPARCVLDKIEHYSRYKRNGSVGMRSREQVLHNYGYLETIQLVDLPFESGKEYELVVHPYNKHNLVIGLNGSMYKIPHPARWDTIVEECVVKCVYRRTAMKGYLDKVQ